MSLLEIDAAGALVIRTRLEERTPLQGLAGDVAYAATTRFRLEPGFW